MDQDEMCSLLTDQYPQFSASTVRAVLHEHDYRIGPSSDALKEMSSRQGTDGASSSRQGGLSEQDERQAQIRRDALLARSMQAHSISDSPMRRGGDGGIGLTPDDPWTETLNSVSEAFESNVRTAVDYASTFGGWASDLMASLDPTSLLFEDDEDYDQPNRPAADTARDKEGVSMQRSPLTQRSRGPAERPVPPPHSNTDEEDEDEFDDSAGAQLAAWLGGEEEVSYAKKDK